MAARTNKPNTISFKSEILALQKSYCIAGIILRRGFSLTLSFFSLFSSIPLSLSPSLSFSFCLSLHVVWLSSISNRQTDAFRMVEHNKFHILFISTIKIYVCKHKHSQHSRLLCVVFTRRLQSQSLCFKAINALAQHKRNGTTEICRI